MQMRYIPLPFTLSTICEPFNGYAALKINLCARGGFPNGMNKSDLIKLYLHGGPQLFKGPENAKVRGLNIPTMRLHCGRRGKL